eukprot:m.20043 g.20043  ORF g.20043 m.20043 type:complete len:1310 (+) comp27959_c0_seq1:623-4552(+)
MDTLGRRRKKFLNFIFPDIEPVLVRWTRKEKQSVGDKAREALKILRNKSDPTGLRTIRAIEMASSNGEDKVRRVPTAVDLSTPVASLFQDSTSKSTTLIDLVVSLERLSFVPTGACDPPSLSSSSALRNHDGINKCQSSPDSTAADNRDVVNGKDTNGDKTADGSDADCTLVCCPELDAGVDRELTRKRSDTDGCVYQFYRKPLLSSDKRPLSYDSGLRAPRRQGMIRFCSFKKKTTSLKLLLPGDESVCLTDCSGDMTVKELRDKFWDLLEEAGCLERIPGLRNREDFVMKYTLDGSVYELYDQLQMVQTLKVYQKVWKYNPDQPGELILDNKRKKTDDEKRLDLKIGYCLDMDLRSFSMVMDNQLNWHRRVLVNVCRQALKKRNPQIYSMEPDIVHNLPLPSHILDDCSFCGEIQIDFYCGDEAPNSTHYFAEFSVETLADKIVKEAYWHYNHPGLVSGPPGDFTLKVCGYEDYIWGSHKIIDFRHIRKCVVDEKPVQLTLVKKPDFSADELPPVLQMDLVDDSGQLNGNQEQLTAKGKSPQEVFVISMWDLNSEFRVKIVGVDMLKPLLRNKKSNGSPMMEKMGNIYIEAAIYHGGQLLSAVLPTNEMPFSCNLRFQQWLNFGIKTKDIPKAARLCIVIKAHVRGAKAAIPLHWVNLQLLDHRSVLQCGDKRLGLWPSSMDSDDVAKPGSGMQPDCAVGPNTQSNVTVMHVTFPSYADGHPVVCPSGTVHPDSIKPSLKVADHDPPKDSEMEKCLLAALKKDSLESLTPQEKDAVWVWQQYVGCNYPKALPKCFLSVNYANKTQVIHAHEMLQRWSRPISLEIALQLLNSHFADERVRQLAIRCLKELSNEELQLYLLQLVQGLKYEPYDDSFLARFLLKRALRSKMIGHSLFWYLRAEFKMSRFVNRFGALLEAYLRYCGKAMLNEIYCECQALNALNPIASALQQLNEPKEKGISFLHDKLRESMMPESFLLPYNNRLRVGKLLISRCKFMTSSKKPLWLEFENADPSAKDEEPVKFLFKLGDDLRQDMLTLRTLMIMDRLWQEKGLNLHLLPYGCTATGVKEGVIEAVSSALTVTRIHMAAGSKSFNEKAITNWLSEYVSAIPAFADCCLSCSHNTEKDIRQKANMRFVNSCAGYCVASFVLGIADRHGDNIMVGTNGNVIHIDFGHFLGNVKHFRLWRLKIKKEMLPFALGADFVHVMGGDKSSQFKTFRSICSKAYNVLRENSGLFLDLFHLMKSTGMKELASTDDIVYLKEKLMPEATAEAAEKHFQRQIDICIKGGWAGTRQQISDFIHYLSQSQKRSS